MIIISYLPPSFTQVFLPFPTVLIYIREIASKITDSQLLGWKLTSEGSGDKGNTLVILFLALPLSDESKEIVFQM